MSDTPSPASRARAAASSLILALLLACRFEPLHEFDGREPPPPAPSPPPTVPTVDEASQPRVGWESMLRQHLGFLTGSRAAGRRPGTDGARLTQSLATANFSEAGLTPDGLDRGWTQPVEVVVVSNHRVSVSLRLPDTETDSRIVLDSGIFIHRGRITDTYEGEHGLAEVDLPRNLDTLALPESIAGKLVVGKLPPKLLETSEQFMARAQTVFEAAEAAGAAGVLLALPTGERRTEVVEAWSVPDVRVVDLGFGAAAHDLHLRGFVDAATFDVLSASAESNTTARISIESQRRRIEDANIVGRIVGEEEPQKVVLVTAHYDAGGLSPPLPRGGGTIDNGTGLAALFALAEVSGRWSALGRKPRRSIVFAATAAGSLGELGTPALLEIPGLDPDNLVAMINLDYLDWRGEPLTVVDGHEATLGALALELDPSLVIESSAEPLAHDAFARAGVPAITLRRTSPEGPVEFSDSISLDTLARDAEVAFRMIWQVADRASIPSEVEAEVDEAVAGGSMDPAPPPAAPNDGAAERSTPKPTPRRAPARPASARPAPAEDNPSPRSAQGAAEDDAGSPAGQAPAEDAPSPVDGPAQPPTGSERDQGQSARPPSRASQVEPEGQSGSSQHQETSTEG